MSQELEIYLDNNASTEPLDEVVQTVAGFMREGVGNASSAHRRGARGRAHLLRARRVVAASLGAREERIVFTSGGTEGNNTVLFGATAPGAVRRLVTTAVEHPSILRPAEELARRGADVVTLTVDRTGRIDLDELDTALMGQRSLVAVQWANSETGVLQPIPKIAELCRRRGALLHVDAAQAAGRVPIDVEATGIDFLAFSGHKLHGPQGIGVLYVRDPETLVPLLRGGDQEAGHRAGTENLPGIAGLARACEIRAAGFGAAVARMRALRDRFERQILAEVDDARVNGAAAPRVCNTASIRFRGVDGQALLAQLDRAGILCSQTSACSSRRPEPSHALRAMGLSEDEAFASLRFSFSVLNTNEEVDRAVDIIREAVARLRAFLQL